MTNILQAYKDGRFVLNNIIDTDECFGNPDFDFDAYCEEKNTYETPEEIDAFIEGFWDAYDEYNQ